MNVRRYIVVVILCGIAAANLLAQDTRFALGGHGGLAINYGGDFFSFKPSTIYGGQLRFYPGGNWFIELGYDRFNLKNDESNLLADSIGAFYNNDTLRFNANRYGLALGRYLFPRYRKLNISAALEAAIVDWKVLEPRGDTAVSVRGPNQQPAKLSASELSIGGSASLSWQAARSVSLDLFGRYEYLTGAGAEFESKVSSSRDRWLMSVGAGVKIHFGKPSHKSAWPSNAAWSTDNRDSELKRRLTKGRQATAGDADRDGVPDQNDDCPGTPSEAAGMVDIHGCPVDADFDGAPDYRDSCRNTPVGALVDDSGCPVDSDGDGVPDGLDDCPDSPAGVPIDRFGCIDLSMFSRPIVLNIDYLPGSFEIDVKTKDRLKKISGVLLLVPEVKMEIVGYTDNIGLPEANQKLSEKRANRVRDYLIAMGVPAERMKASGRGEENQIASNETAEGRNKNRRIEITFYR
jgi:outer membrane protein OmpA-like peptidoglycan-associated protein